MSDVILQIDKLEAFYGDAQVLFGVSLSLRAGEMLALIGANGAGKSALLRSICGLLLKKKGSIRFKGEEILGASANDIVARGIAMVPEGRRLFPSLSVEENLVLGGNVRRSGHWNLDAVYDLFPILKEKRHVPSTSLSGGQQQMVAIGRALMANPDVLLFDEISLGLAPIVIKQIYQALPQVIAEGMSAIIVEQDISQAMAVSDRVYCLQEGRVALEGASGEVSREQIAQAYFGI